MLTRRAVQFGIIAAPLLSTRAIAFLQEAEEVNAFDQLDYPQFSLLSEPSLFGYRPATAAQRETARQIINQTPKGPMPIDVAQSFVTRFAKTDPDAISQWPRPSNWNPLVVEFFRVTSTKANNDMVAWCAAFANWCIEWAGRNGSKSASSQSFLKGPFSKTTKPKRGDLAIWTCFNAKGQSLGLGHVAFFDGPVDDRYINVVGGNQSANNHSSIISANKFPIYDRKVTRSVGNGVRVPCTMKLNCYIAMS